MRVNVKLVLFFLFLSNAALQAQTSTLDSLQRPINMPDAGIIFNWQTNSTALTNKFLLETIGDGLSESAKAKSLKKLLPVNRFVNQVEGGLYYVLPLKSMPNTGLIIAGSAATDMSASFTQDAFELLMNGNASYKNETKEVGKLNFRSMNYQKLGIGLRKSNAAKTQYWYGTADFVIGDRVNLFQLSRGSVFTETNGEYLDVDMAFKWHYNDNAKLFNPKGYGFALNAGWIKRINSGKSIIQFDIKDLGMVKFNNSATYKYLDTTMHFEGFDYGTINNKTLLHDFNLKDSLTEKFNIKTTNEAFRYILSSRLELRYEKAINSKRWVSLQAKGYLFNATPSLSMTYGFILKNNWNLMGSTRIGGYSKFDLDLGARYTGSKYYFDALLASVEGLILPKQCSGLGASVHFGFYLPKK